jgi:hypothetical protein
VFGLPIFNTNYVNDVRAVSKFHLNFPLKMSSLFEAPTTCKTLFPVKVYVNVKAPQTGMKKTTFCM